MYMLNVQFTAFGRKTVSDRGMARSCDPLKILGAPIITEPAEPKVDKFCTHVGYDNSQHKNDKNHP